MAGKGGRGGNADVEGDSSCALGGHGGQGVIGDGGEGGRAIVRGNHSTAIGGKGGRGGVGKGGPGGHAEVHHDDGHAEGGQGGESSQQDGRGGRGGRPGGLHFLQNVLGEPQRTHMKWPYGEPITEPGRGGDSPDTPQYMARRLIVEEFKKDYFFGHGVQLDAPHKIWWDREIVPLRWIKDKIANEGHRWTVKVVDWEYEFVDAL